MTLYNTYARSKLFMINTEHINNITANAVEIANTLDGLQAALIEELTKLRANEVSVQHARSFAIVAKQIVHINAIKLASNIPMFEPQVPLLNESNG